MVKKFFKSIGHWIVQHINFILLILVIVMALMTLRSGLSGVYAEREYKRQQIENQIAIEKAETEKEIAILEAQREAEVARLKSGWNYTEGN